mgnify:FL=1
MGLINKNSIFDRIPNGNSTEDDKYIGENIEGSKFDLGNQSTLQPDSLSTSYLDLDGQPDSLYNRQDHDPGFTIFPERGVPIASDSPFESPTGDHMVDLLDKFKITSNNSGQVYRGTPAPGQGFDLNGYPGPQFDLGKESELQQDSLLSLDLDLNGVDEGQGLFDKGKDSNLQQDSLLNQYEFNHGNSNGKTGPSELDLNTTNDSIGDISKFDLGKDSELQQDSLFMIPDPPGNFSDLNGEITNGGQGYFHGVNNPGKGQGLQVKGEDLHEHLLTNSYTYSHGGKATTVLGGKSKEGISGKPGGKLDLDGKDLKLWDKGKDSLLHENLLTKTYRYNPTGLKPGLTNAGPGGLDLDGTVGGNGFFHGVANPGAGQGFQVKPTGLDLHVHMLENGYGTRTVHASVNSFNFIKESRAAGQMDLDGGLPSYGSYSSNKPEPGARM